MAKQTSEKAYETYIESTLFEKHKWQRRDKESWDKQRALFVDDVVGFIADTQPVLWKSMVHQHGAELKDKVIDTLCKELNTKGSLQVLRHGFKFYGKIFKLAYFKPAHCLNPDVIELYNKNRLIVSRQIPCHPNDNRTIDMVLALNGLPIATCELKNPNSNQTWRDAINQYKTDREPNAPLFDFKKRALVHFAVDVDEIHMTTKLAKDNTFFLPFNRGSHPNQIKCGKGNPIHPSGHRSGYFWHEILQPDSFLDIIANFMFVEKSDEKTDDGHGGKKITQKETMIFPRYHQIDAVRKLITASSKEGAGNNYLIQHSAGSGKTKSISWLSHRLASLHNANDEKIFDCVVVITDRQVLDSQLQDAIYQIEHSQGVVKPIDQDSKQLAEALVDGTQIVVTTLQKFPFVLSGLLHVAGAETSDNATEEQKNRAKEWEDKIAARKYAVIVDEAHSSQTGETARELKEILGAGSSGEDEDFDFEDRLNQVMESRGKQKNISFFAFTATPKGKTLMLFGRNGDNGKPVAFHTYSMRQAIEEGFILDVLKNYTTYDTYFELVKAIEQDPDLPKKKATRALAKFMVLHPVNISQRIEIIVEHFRLHIKHNMNNRAKAMIVTSSRLQAVKYMLAFKEYIKQNRYEDVRPLVAFSGTVKDPETGIEYTEPGMNIDCVTGKSISEKQLPERFKSTDFQVLLVANKYQTGFDQPLLQAMYVDKRLDGVQAVQTLSRLNRIATGKISPFVLDFVNKSEDIYKAFKPYYDVTNLEKPSDPHQLERLKIEMDEMQIYHTSEINAFSEIFYKPLSKHNVADHARLEKHLQPAVDRFKALEDDDQRQLFRDKLRSYVNLYSFMSQIIPWTDPEQEKLYSFGRFLLPHLQIGREPLIVSPENDVELKYYRIERVSSGAIDLDSGEIMQIKSPTDVGTGKSKDEKRPLSDIIRTLNERFSTEFSEEDRLFFEQIKEKACNNEHIIQTAKANPLDKFELGIKKMIEKFMIQRLGQNDNIVSRYMDDKEFQNIAFPILAREIFATIQERA